MTAALFGAALFFAAVAPASAKDNGHHGQHGRGPQGQGHQARSGYYRVPQVIAVEHRGDYRPYFTGRSYYAPHNHYHAAYRFPVWVNGAVVYRTYPYCENHLFVNGAVTLPQLAIGFTFGNPGTYVSGYYASPAPPAYYIYEEPRRHHCDRDGDWDGD
jgi:hypothetical protein